MDDGNQDQVTTGWKDVIQNEDRTWEETEKEELWEEEINGEAWL
jgi:hypothetical protein